MKPKLLLLSDLWGKEKSIWLADYLEVLEQYYQCVYYDCCDLAGIDKNYYTEEYLHQQFINGGIEKAVDKLKLLEKECINILAFSIGGTIAWKFSLEVDNVQKMYCISSTRLRYESFLPQSEVYLFYGELDAFKPDQNWLDTMDVDYEIMKDEKHDMYMSSSFIPSFISKSNII